MNHARIDITEHAKLLLQAISETKGRFGLNLPIEVLVGRKNARITKQGFELLPCHGKGAQHSEDYWKAIGQSLIQELLVDGRNAGGGKGFGKGKGPKLTIYSVSSLGRRLLDGQVAAPILADVEADAMQASRAKRPQRGMPASNEASVPPQAKQEAKRQKTSARQSTAKTSLTSNSSAENGLRPTPNPGEIMGQEPLPRALDKALMPFQRAGVAFAVRREGRVLIGDDMGLGKTIQAIATACAFRHDWPALVVVPNSVSLVWADELERWIPDLGPFGVNVVKTGSDLSGLSSGAASFHLMSYGLLTRASPVRDFLRDRNPCKSVIVDESHMMKNRTSLRTRELLQIIKNASRVMLLSGTPALARPLELYTQIEAIEPGLFKSYSAFTSRYCAPKWTPFGMDLTGASNLDELHSYLRQIMVRRLKAEVLHELPAKRRQRIQIEVDKTAVGACASMKEELQNLDPDDHISKQRMLVNMLRETSVAKEAPVCEYVENLFEGGCKFLVFGHHLAMLNALQATATRNNVKFIRIDGSVSAAERLNRVNAFQSDDTVRVAILGMMAAGVGITLTAASTVVFAELHWTPGVLVQAEDRAHRIGQKSSVNVHYLVAKDTVDDMIWQSVYRKVEVISKMCDGRQDHLVAGFSRADKALESVAQPGRDSAGGIGVLLDDAGSAKVDKVPDFESPKSAEKTKKQPPAFNVLSMLQGRTDLKRWTCQTCGEGNSAAASKCGRCCDVRATSQAANATHLVQPIGDFGRHVIDVDDIVAEDDAIESASDAEHHKDTDLGIEGDDHRKLCFCVSRTTSRVHVMDAVKRPVGCNFKLSDWQAVKDASLVFAEALNNEPFAIRLTEAFLRQWAALKVGEQRKLLDQVVFLPLSGCVQKKSRSSRQA